MWVPGNERSLYIYENWGAREGPVISCRSYPTLT